MADGNGLWLLDQQTLSNTQRLRYDATMEYADQTKVEAQRRFHLKVFVYKLYSQCIATRKLHLSS